MGGSSVRDEVGGDLDSKNHAASPNSPSSSGGFRQFSSKGLSIEDMSAQHYFGGCNGTICARHCYVVWPESLFLECRVAVVLGTFN